MNELDLIKLNIYEAYETGEITEAEKEYLLEQVDVVYEDGWEDGTFAATANKYDMSTGGKNLQKTKAYKQKQADDILRKQKISGTAAQSAYDDRYAEVLAKQANKEILGKRIKKGALIGAGVAGVAYGISKGVVAAKKAYDKSQNALLKKKSKLENQLKNTKNVKEKLAIMKEIKAINAQIKELENKSDKKLNKAMKESSTFDYLLESIDDLYYDEY